MTYTNRKMSKQDYQSRKNRRMYTKCRKHQSCRERARSVWRKN